jgi:hypothetical protein
MFRLLAGPLLLAFTVSSLWHTKPKKGAEHGIRRRSIGCGSFSIFDYAFIAPCIRKEEKMDLVIGILVVIILVFGIVWLMQRT